MFEDPIVTKAYVIMQDSKSEISPPYVPTVAYVTYVWQVKDGSRLHVDHSFLIIDTSSGIIPYLYRAEVWQGEAAAWVNESSR